MDGLFTAIEREVIESSHEVCMAALQSSAYELQIDIANNICYKVVDDYYNEYTPKKYKRIRSLYDAWDVSSAAIVNDRLHFYPRLDENRLPEHRSRSKYHQSGDEWINSWYRSDDDDNGTPENKWILDNFFEGIHPGYYIDRKTGILVNDSKYYPGVLSNMKKHIDIYKKKKNMINILAKHLRQACKAYSG